MKAFAFFASVLAVVIQTSGHGMLWDPPSRSSMWRFGFDVPPNYDDNQVYCGGFGVQWNQNGGKCGVCGDPYQTPQPRDNENGGKYGRGIISKTYKQGSVIPITVRLNAAHLGAFTFQICNLDNSPETDQCFQPVKLADGSDSFKVGGPQDYNLQLQLPQGLTCKQCALRWHYRAGNTWGQCDDGTSAMGCGPQETFRNCADIAIQ